MVMGLSGHDGICLLVFTGVECLGFKGEKCRVGGLSMLMWVSVSKELCKGNVLSEKNELEKLGMPHLMQIHETLLPTNPA